MAFIQPLELQPLLVNLFAGSMQIFTFIAFIFIGAMSAFFRMSNFAFLMMFGLFAIAMGAERFFTEFWRTDPNVLFDTFSMAQIISFFLFLFGIGLVYYVNRVKGDS